MTTDNSRAQTSFRALSSIIAALLFIFAFIKFFNPGALASNEYWWLMIVAMAIGIIGFTLRTPWQIAGLVAATFLIGYGAQLALKQPIWFQVVRIRPTSDFSYVMLSALALQGITGVFVLLRNNIFTHAQRVISKVGWLRVILVLLVLCGGSMSAMRQIVDYDYRSFIEQLIIGSAFLALNFFSFIALVISLPASSLEALSTAVKQNFSRPGDDGQIKRLDKRLPHWFACTTFGICTFISVVVFDGIPRVDETTYFFHAKYFSQGMLTLPLPHPPLDEAFGTYLIDSYDGKWFATWPPGWPMVLAVGIIFNVYWLLNPLMAAMSILLFHFFVRSIMDRGTANLITCLMAISPWFLATSSTLMSHTLVYFLILGAWCLLIKTHDRPTFYAPLIAGGLMGMVFLTRPLDGLVIGTLTGLWTLIYLKVRTQWTTPLFYGAGCLAVGGLIFPYNAHLTGSLFQTPLNTYLDKLWGIGANQLGFGADIGPQPNWGRLDPYPGHSPFEALVQAQQMFYALNFELFGWGIGSVIFVLIFVLWGKWSKLTAAMLTISALTVSAYTLYWFSASFYIGPRYWFLIIVPMFILSGSGLILCAKKFREIYPSQMAPERMTAGIGFLCLCSIFVFMNWLSFNKYPDFRDGHPEYYILSTQDIYQNSIIFISSDFEDEFENAIWLNNFNSSSTSPLFARDLGMEKNLQVASAYPNRKIYFADGWSSNQRHVSITPTPITLQQFRKSLRPE